MKSVLSFDVLLFVTILVATFTGLSQAELEQTKNRRASGALGLVAFPRVGRSDPNINDNNNLQEMESLDSFDNYHNNRFEDYDDYNKGEIKRSSLIAFPRIGRTDAEIRKWAKLVALQQAMDKRTGPSATSGLWFGPRLGKRSIDTRDFESKTKNENSLY